MATRTARTTSRMQTRLSSEDPGDKEPNSERKDPTPAESLYGSPDSKKGSKGGRSKKPPRGGSGGTPGGTPPPSEPSEDDEEESAETASSTNTSELD